VVVAGGTYFAHTIEETLADGRVDVIVRGEGEVTFVELLRRLHRRESWAEVPGIAFKGAAGRTVITPARPLVEDLDALPFPAYDLLDMRRYGRGSRNHPGLVSIEHSRGCVDSCGFCILWKHMGQSVNGNGRVRPCYRSKSAMRSFDDVMRLVRDFGRRTFGWVDPTFNADAAWSDAWADLMLASPLVGPRGPRTVHTAWMRADCIVRDARLGVLDKLVRAGLRQVMIGVERDDAAGLDTLGKHGNGAEVCREAFAILRERHPEVFTIGSVVFGLPQDTPDDLRRLARCEADMGMDYCFYIPLTPNPGTAVAAEAARRGLVANLDLASYNFHTPVCATETMGLKDLESLYWRMLLDPSPRRAVRWVRQLLLPQDARKRRVHLALLRHGVRVAAASLARAVLHPKDRTPALYSRRPSWYDQ
jgi:anaerobic magnesium-protoporphyrin IX monomethyl ester cyclase